MIFLDSSFIISREIENDQNHKEAVDLAERINQGIYGEPVISEYIFNEIATLFFIKLKSLEKTIERCEIIKNIKMFRISERIFDDAWNIFKEQKNTKLSFTDCTTIAAMSSEGVKNIATFDKDFKKIDGINVID